MKRAPLLIEIGCEEIPARMIQPAAQELAQRLQKTLDAAGLERGAISSWGGSRRLTVRVEQVAERQPDKDELLLGPPIAAAFDGEGKPTPAAAGFARKHGIEAAQLQRLDTERGAYVGVRRRAAGRSIAEVLAESLPQAVETMPFPKVMRWGDGSLRWVRPVHWLLALHGDQVVPLSLLGIASGRLSVGHRFLGSERVEVLDADSYAETLERAFVVVDPARRRRLLAEAMQREAAALGGAPIEDPALLEEIADLVEWPGVVAGSFDPDYLSLPRELLVTTLRHHQKCFSVQDANGEVLPHFLAVANTDRDRRGHVRRGNEWVIGGRLEDARFFWREDRRTPLAERSQALERVVVHAKLGSYAERAQRLERLTVALAALAGLEDEATQHAAVAARLAKNDLVTGTVGEFPELQGRVGGLLLDAEGQPKAVARGVYEHYQPVGPSDTIPSTSVGRVVAAADKLETLIGFLSIGEQPTGSRDPFGLRRAANGLIRIAVEADWRLTADDLFELSGRSEPFFSFLSERLEAYFRESGYTTNEVQAVFRPRIGRGSLRDMPLGEIRPRLEAIRTVRGRDDFVQLVKLTQRVDTILVRNAFVEAAAAGAPAQSSDATTQGAAGELKHRLEASIARIEQAHSQRQYDAIVDALAELVRPVDRFFTEVLVVDPQDPPGTAARLQMLDELRSLLVRHFDIRELAGQAERRE